MENKIVVTVNDYQRLIGLMEFSALSAKKTEVVSQLYSELLGAEMLRQENIDREVVTMNSRILLRELGSNRQTEITLTYPHEADPRDRRVSVLSPIGRALLGRRERDVVSWRVPTGVGEFEIVKVVYQPEAAGDFYL